MTQLLAKNLAVLLSEVSENTGKDAEYAYFMSKEIRTQFKQLKKDYKKCKDIAAQNERHFWCLKVLIEKSS